MKAIIIMGPTGIGKSDLAIRLAFKLKGEIVCIDSKTIYRGINIGTSKPTESDRNKVPHHMLDILDLDENANAAWFSKKARKITEDIFSRGKTPLLVGGSGLYFKSILRGLFDINLSEDERKVFSESITHVETPELYKRLLKCDEESAERIHPNDRYRISRALEVHSLSGIPLSEHIRKQDNSDLFNLQSVKIGLNTERPLLHQRINNRVEEMLRDGWIDEVKNLLSAGVKPQWPGMQTLGYPEVISYLRNRTDYNEMKEKISARTRQYAKSQITWFKKEEKITWINTSKNDPYIAALKVLDREF
ncbi:MAG TPA: tRNA (adenosine(37)-N6)-dimethylallyltransferase MiaA [Candidatus Krumholzibacteriaceae bacterium]|nr:tRNA (adenosine(37)-N6)-dimethylallyltransferase MiaA [Candidatus Krumholzibacteriaceae bacterium]